MERARPPETPDAARRVNGSIALILALAAGVLALAVGGAIDLAYWLRARSATRAAVDAAVLRGARELQTNPGRYTDAVLAAGSLYRSTVYPRLALRNDVIRFEVADSGAAMVAQGRVAVATPFLSLLSMPPVPLLAFDGADNAKGVVTVGLNARQHLELALVVDTSAVAGANMAALKSALAGLVDAVIWTPSNAYRARAAVVPFADGVSPGGLLDKVAPAKPRRVLFDTVSGLAMRLPVSICVGERAGAQAFTDGPPAGLDVLPRVYASNAGCLTPSSVQPLTGDISVLHGAITGLIAGPSAVAAVHIGAAWGWYLLSPAWASIFNSGSEPDSYAGITAPPGTSGSLKKVVVLIGTGAQDLQYCNSSSAPGIEHVVLPDRNSAADPQAAGVCVSPNGGSKTQLEAICAGMRDKGISLFTIFLGPRGNGVSSGFNTCAGAKGSFYEASDAQEIDLAIQDIETKITSSYLSQ